MKRRELKKGTKDMKPKPFKIKIDPKEFYGLISLPRIEYEVSAFVERDDVFEGEIVTIPRILIFFLTHTELKLFVYILEESIREGECRSTLKELSKKLKLSIPSISNAFYDMRKMGLLFEGPNGMRGGGRTKKINFKAVQHLNDLLEGENPDVYSRIRKASRKTDILKMTKADIHKGYDNHVLTPNHDPEEEEEYD